MPAVVHGWNLVYLLRNGYQVFAVDQDPTNIADVRRLAATLARNLPAVEFPRRARRIHVVPGCFR